MSKRREIMDDLTCNQKMAMKVLGASAEPLLLLLFHEANVSYLSKNIVEKTRKYGLTIGEGELEKILFFKIIDLYRDTRLRSRCELRMLLVELNRKLVQTNVESIQSGVKSFGKYKTDFLAGNPIPYDRPHKIFKSTIGDKENKGPWV